MSLSREEQYKLEKLEHQLEAEDPKLASTFASSRVDGTAPFKVFFGILMILIGVAQLLAGVNLLGLLVVSIGIYYAVRYGFYNNRKFGS